MLVPPYFGGTVRWTSRTASTIEIRQIPNLPLVAYSICYCYRRVSLLPPYSYSRWLGIGWLNWLSKCIKVFGGHSIRPPTACGPTNSSLISHRLWKLVLGHCQFNLVSGLGHRIFRPWCHTLKYCGLELLIRRAFSHSRRVGTPENDSTCQPTILHPANHTRRRLVFSVIMSASASLTPHAYLLYAPEINTGISDHSKGACKYKYSCSGHMHGKVYILVNGFILEIFMLCR